MPYAAAQPSDARYRETLLTIQQRMEQNDLAGAKELIAQARSIYPGDGGLDNLSGVVAIQQGHRDEAIEAFSSAIAHAPALASPYLNLGRIYSGSAEEDKAARASALAIYDKLLHRLPRNAEANYQVALLLLWDKQYQQSLNHLQLLNTEDRNRIGSQLIVCADEAALKHREATDTAAAHILADPGLTEQDAMEPLAALRAGRRADLIEKIFTAVDARTPLSPNGLRILGLAQEGNGKLEIARSTLERAFTQSPTSVPILVDLTRIARNMKDYQGALGYLAHARELQPNDAGFAYEFGVLTLRMALLAESQKAMAEAVRLAPDNPDYNFGMGVVYSFSQDATEGLPYLETYHRLRPSDPAGLLSIGTTYFRVKDFDSASIWLNKAAASPATAADAHFYLGRIARVRNRLADAERELAESDKLLPNQPAVLAEIGQVHLASRTYPEAEKYLDRALKLDPENYGANYGLLQLYARTGDPRRDEQSKHFEQIKSKSEENYLEMMRIIQVHAQ